MAQLDLGRGRPCPVHLLPQELVDLRFAHTHPGIHLTLAQALLQELAAQFLAERVARNAIGRQTPVHLVGGHLVLSRHALHRLIHRQIIDNDAALAGQLHQGQLLDELLQGLARQQVLRRLGAALAGHLALQALHAGAHLAVGHGLGIDDGDDEVGLPRSCRGHGAGCWKARAPHARRPGQTHPLRHRALRHKRGQADKADGNSTWIHGLSVCVSRSC